jgi:hypothetical protein
VQRKMYINACSCTRHSAALRADRVANTGERLLSTAEIFEQHTGLPNDVQFAYSMGVHEPSSVFAVSEYSQDVRCVQPNCTGTHVLSSVFAVALKLNAMWSVHPRSFGTQLEEILTFAVGLKLNAALSMHPDTAI